MKVSVRPLLVGALMAGVLWNTVPAWSQTEAAPLQTRKAYEIPVQNVPAHLMAWWLDPTNQPRPAEMGILVPNDKTADAPFVGGTPVIRWLDPANQPRPGAMGRPVPDHKTVASPPVGGAFIIPGIEKIVADDAQKKLLIFGEEAAVQKLRDTVAFLDRPLRQVELETHLVFMKPEDLQAFGLDFTPPTAPPQGNPGTLPPTSLDLTTPSTNWLTLLKERTRTGQMSELTVPRITTYNNMSATLDIPLSHPLPFDLQNRLAAFMAALTPQDDTSTLVEMQTPLKIMLAPTINNDSTVTVLLNLKAQMQLAREGASPILLLGKPSEIISIANLKDGDTIALGGFDPTFTSAFISPVTPQSVPTLGDLPIFSGLFRSKQLPHDEKQLPSGQMVMFLTARIVHRGAP